MWWNSGTVMVGQCSGTVEQWNSGKVMVEQWNSNCGTVEQWNSDGGIVEQWGGTVEQ